MREVTIKIYKIDELSEAVKAKVVEKFRYTNVDYDEWSEFITDEFEAKLEELGYKDIKVLYSGFGSQGDGACFTARLDIPKWLSQHKEALTAEMQLLFDNFECYELNITHSGRYYHARSMDYEEAYFDESITDNTKRWKLQSQFARFVELVKAEAEDLAVDLYKELEEHYMALTEDSEVIETIKANDYEFTEDGGLYNE